MIVVPDDVGAEIRNGRTLHSSILDPSATSWVQMTVLTEEEIFTQLIVKAALGGRPRKRESPGPVLRQELLGITSASTSMARPADESSAFTGGKALKARRNSAAVSPMYLVIGGCRR
ncbi:MAG: hypothetical protein QM650_19145 [Microlunatus sp.]